MGKDIVTGRIHFCRERRNAKSLVEIYQVGNRLHGKLVALLQEQNAATLTCKKCKDDRKNKPLLELEIMRDYRQKGDMWKKGTILDPSSGKIYHSNQYHLEMIVQFHHRPLFVVQLPSCMSAALQMH